MMRRVALLVLVVFGLVVCGPVAIGPSHAVPAQAGPRWLVPPVDGPVARSFVAPATEFGSGHRGMDFVVPHGTLVRAAAPGTVTFAGSVAGLKGVTIDHGGAMATTYTRLAEVSVRDGDAVSQGTWIGRTDEAHAGTPGLHFGVRVDGRYVDPVVHLAPLNISDAIHLAPVEKSGFDVLRRDCDAAPSLDARPAPPNDNIAVAIAGIGSRTRGGLSADMYEYGPELLGYPPDSVYRFSYRGHSNDALHVPYLPRDTEGDLRTAAARLRDLLRSIARRHPGRAVDLIAHSQGGIVARTLLESLSERWSNRLPRVDHLVTLATPHGGAPLASLVEDLQENTISGGAALALASRWARNGGPLPDPRSIAVGQLATDSSLIEWLASEDVIYGTRALSLTMPHDLVVPADRARWESARSRVVPPEGLEGHSAVVASQRTRAIAHGFLRDAAPTCEGGWDTWGPRLGALVSFAERKTGWALGRVEDAVIGRIGRLVGRVLGGLL